MIGALAFVITWASACFCAFTLAALVGARSLARVVVTAALAAGLLAAIPGELCRVIGDFRASMFAAAALFVVVALAVRRFSRTTDSAPAFIAPHWIAIAIAAVAFAFVVDGAVTRDFFDEDHHVPMAMVIARGLVPPRHPLAAFQVIPYHWGIDALYAQLVVAGLRPDRAIDVVTIASFPLFVLAAAWLGGSLAGKTGATLGAIMTPLAGSALAWPLHDDMGVLQLDNPFPQAWKAWDHRPPPITADFFQHPQGLAFSLVLVVVALFTADARKPRLAIGALLLGCLSLVQSIHFLVLGFGLAAATSIDFFRTRDVRALAWRAGLLAGSLALAVLFGGFFDPGAPTAGTLAWGQRFLLDGSPLEAVLHMAAVFGLPLVLLPLAARKTGFTHHVLVAGAAIGFILPNVVVYTGSWDIVKLFSAGAFLAGAALSSTLARFVDAASSRTRIALVAVAVAFTIWFPLAWLATRTVMQGHLGVPAKHDWRLRDNILAAGRALSPYIPRDARVLVSDPEMARMNGFLAPGFDVRRYAPFHMLDYAAARRLVSAHDVAIRDLDPNSLLALDVDYAILSTAEVARLHIQLDGLTKVADAPGFTLWSLH